MNIRYFLGGMAVVLAVMTVAAALPDIIKIHSHQHDVAAAQKQPLRTFGGKILANVVRKLPMFGTSCIQCH